ncbi:hypothetical protein SAMN05720354_1117 [Nitrosospira sp. Nsp1]|nr:hypothetical protein SAMN05720354_1117 [Nitrosospira sp. Nsp1]
MKDRISTNTSRSYFGNADAHGVSQTSEPNVLGVIHLSNWLDFFSESGWPKMKIVSHPTYDELIDTLDCHSSRLNWPTE